MDPWLCDAVVPPEGLELSVEPWLCDAVVPPEGLELSVDPWLCDAVVPPEGAEQPDLGAIAELIVLTRRIDSTDN